MPNDAQQAWEDRYRAGEFGLREPDPFVIDAHRDYMTPLLPADAAGLDLAGGAGHHALWLARQGWRMTLADWSETALELAREQSRTLPAQAVFHAEQESALDLVRRWQTEGRRFGFVLVSFFLDRAVLPLLPEILVPGGLLLYRTYTEDNERLGNPRGPRRPEYLLRSQELLEVFRGMRILHYHETVARKGVAELIAQRRQD